MSNFEQGLQNMRNRYNAPNYNKMKALKWGNKGQTNFLRVSQLVDGAPYYIRFLPPDPTKNPAGFVVNELHSLQVKEGQDPISILCPTIEFNEPCPLCQLLETVAGLESHTIPEAVMEFVGMLKPNVNIQTYMAISATKEVTTENGKEQTMYIPSSTDWLGVVFTITSETLFNDLLNIRELDPNFNNIELGSYFTIQRNHTKTELKVFQARTPFMAQPQFKEKRDELIKNYPAITKFHRGTQGKAKENNKQKHAQDIQLILNNAFWYKPLLERIQESRSISGFENQMNESLNDEFLTGLDLPF